MTRINVDIDDQACAEIMRQIISNRLTFSKCLTTAPSAGCERPKQLQSPREDGRRTPRQIEYTKKDRDFDGVSNRLTFSKCLTTASSAGCERPNQLQTPREDRRRTARQIEYTKMPAIFAASQTVSRRRRQPGATARNSFKHPVRTGGVRRGQSSTRRWTEILTGLKPSHTRNASGVCHPTLVGPHHEGV